MRLADWLAREELTQQRFAELIGLTQGRVSQICLRGCGDLNTARAIVMQTKGWVSYDDLVPETEAAE